MKTSFILIVALLLNTTLLFAEPLSALIKGVNAVIFGPYRRRVGFGVYSKQMVQKP